MLLSHHNHSIRTMHLPPRFQATGGIFEDFGDDRLQFAQGGNQGNNMNNPSTNYNNQHLPVATATIVSSTHPQQQQHQQQPQQQQQTKLVHTMSNQQGGGYYPTAIHANYAITPAPTNGQTSSVGGNVMKGRPQTLVVQRHVGQQKLFSVGGPSN